MRHWLRLLPILLLALPLAGLPQPSAQAQAPLDYPIPGGHFYTQADGTAGASGLGFAVSDADGIPFLTYYTQTGGPNEWGYPVSHRFIYQGFTVQIFQKAGFQWNPAAGGVAFLNIFDILHDEGYDAQLQQQYSVPPPAAWPQDAGQPFSVVQQNHLAVLSANPAIQQAFLSNPNWLNINGLPMAPIATYGNVAVLRAQRSVYQQWLQAVPWAAAGQVTVANGGDVAKSLGLWPSWAVTPLAAQQAPLSAMTGPLGPQPTATPNLAVCNGDERISFNPANPNPGQQVSIQVTSARASTNVNLVGPNNPVFQGAGAGGLGTVWNWTVTAGQPGSYEYDFYIGSTPCVRGFLNVGSAPAPTATPTACNGDEVMTFNPPNPNVGQQFSIEVTSARASTNVGLNGPFNPSFAGAAGGGRGTIWTWNAVPNQPGSFTYTFTINGGDLRDWHDRRQSAGRANQYTSSTAAPGVHRPRANELLPEPRPSWAAGDGERLERRSRHHAATIWPVQPGLRRARAGRYGLFVAADADQPRAGHPVPLRRERDPLHHWLSQCERSPTERPHADS
ncbi:MAG: hypothetical protein KatS3mg060_1918 [Dehalococcoidia bacterium]|nr:MAG: hypothetical protein KatS3mg060_1918 [Dehalococcoidia bacterium]